MEKTLEVLNRLEAAGLIGRYAIGGAIAAAYYVEPTVTYDFEKWNGFVQRHFDGQAPAFPIP